MTLTITASPPAIRVTDVDDHMILDTSKSLFHTTDVITGTVSLAGWTPPSNGARTHYLGSCHPDSTFVRAAMRGTWSGTPYATFPNSGWFNVGASFVHVAYNMGIRFWTIEASGGSVVLTDRCYLHEIKNEVGQVLSELVALDLNYILYVGRFAP